MGTLVLGDDIFNLWNQISLFDDYRSHITIEFVISCRYCFYCLLFDCSHCSYC